MKQFTIYEVALLVRKYDPAEFASFAFHQWNPRVRSDVLPIVNALRRSIEDGSLPLHKVLHDGQFGGDLDLEYSLIHVDQVALWLKASGVVDGFFCPANSFVDVPEDPWSDFYAPKLAAANAAWKAVRADSNRLRGKSPKKALEIWLTEHAAKYGLLNKDGTPNATGIEEIAKVANWKPAGGAPTTPKVEVKQGDGFEQTKGPVPENRVEGSFATDLDDDIPF